MLYDKLNTMTKTSWQTLSSSYPLENPWYKVRQDKVIRPDGKDGTYNVIEKPESVFIVPVTDDKQILMVKLFRYTTQREGWEIPAGGIEKGESPEAAAKRELQEETGCVSSSWRSLGDFDSMNSITDSKAHVFIAERLHYGNHHEQEEEGITKMHSFTLSEVLDLIKTGGVVDGLTIAALMKVIVADGLVKLGRH